MSAMVRIGDRFRFLSHFATLILIGFLMGNTALAQSAEEQEAKISRPLGPVDEFDRGVPHTTLEGFLEAARDGDYERATQYLDLRNLPRGLDKSDGSELARKLKIVLDRALLIDLDLVSTDPEGYADDGLPSYNDSVGRLKTPDKTVDILLQRVPREDRVFIWKFSNRTVAEIPHLYEHFGYRPLEETLSKVFPDFVFLGWQIWQWVVFLLLIALAYLAALLPTWLIALLLSRKDTERSRRLAQFVSGPIRIILWLLLIRQAGYFIGVSVTMRALYRAGTLLIIAFAWAALRSIDLLVGLLAERLSEKGRDDLTVLLPTVTNGLKVLVILVTVLVWLDNIGFRVTTVLAGLGIGGLAVALAAQKPLENLIGAITLYASRPVRVGDFCRFGDQIGTVEEIGLRSTNIRTLDHTVVSVPNAEFANLHLDNFSKRDKIWYHPRISLRYETTPDQIRYILVEIRKLLYAHPKVLADPARIRFIGFGAYSLDLDVFAYVDVTDYGEFLEVAEDLNLRIMDIVTEAGSSFAIPSQTTYLERRKGFDEKLAQTAEAHVNQWKENKELYLPSFPEEIIAELAGSLDYPPTGSPAAASRGLKDE
ncbi:MAG: mechanosensitive ion channel family protein [Deltaproteobacteria bacterium]|nr:MAG: mechanosensitive ion channel family protein [Deltaproteobacteria bacterium]